MTTTQDNTQMAADLQRRLGEQFQFSAGAALLQISTPFHYPSGNPIQVLISVNREDGPPFCVDDLGSGAAELKDRLGYFPEKPFDGHLNHLFNQTCNRYDVNMDAVNEKMETVRAFCERDSLPAVICRVIQASLMASYIDE